jgi:hypothetical protein
MTAPQDVLFHLDPRCPWAWQTSKWIRNVEGVRPVRVQWRLFSLAFGGKVGPPALLDPAERGAHALRTLALLRRRDDNEGVGALYEAVGREGHDRGSGLGPDVVRSALKAVGKEPDLVDEAWADDSLLGVIKADHHSAVDAVQAFGVPTIVLPSGRGMFGPVISHPPEGEEAGELWDHFEWFVDKRYFFELKRERDLKAGEREPAPTLPLG